MNYIYQTDIITYGENAKVFQTKLQELLQKRSLQGWKLVKVEMSDFLKTCVVVFEKVLN